MELTVPSHSPAGGVTPRTPGAGTPRALPANDSPSTPLPRSPRPPTSAKDVYEDYCGNGKCRERDRVQRTMLNNLKQEVSSLKLQIAVLMSQLAERDKDLVTRTAERDAASSEVGTLRAAIKQDAHSHGVAIAEKSVKLAILEEQLEEVKLARERQDVTLGAKEAELHRNAVEHGLLVANAVEVEAELTHALAAAPVKRRPTRRTRDARDTRDTTPRMSTLSSFSSMTGASSPPAPASPPAHPNPIVPASALVPARSLPQEHGFMQVHKEFVERLQEERDRIQRESTALQSKLRDRLERVEGQATGLRLLSIRQSHALTVAELAEKQSADKLTAVREELGELRQKHRDEIELKRKQTAVFTALCAQHVDRARKARDAAVDRAKALESQQEIWKEAEVALAAAQAEAELNQRAAEANLDELKSRHALALDQNEALRRAVVAAERKHETTSNQLFHAQKAQAETAENLEGTMNEIGRMANDLTNLKSTVDDQFSAMSEVMAHKEAVSSVVQECMRLALRRLESLEASFGDLLTSDAMSGHLHGPLVQVLRCLANIDLSSRAAKPGSTIGVTELFQHFPLQRWRVHQLSHGLQVCIREASVPRGSQPSPRPRATRAAGHHPGGGDEGWSTADVIAELDDAGLLVAAGPESPLRPRLASTAAREVSSPVRIATDAALGSPHLSEVPRSPSASSPVSPSGRVRKGRAAASRPESPTKLSEIPDMPRRWPGGAPEGGWPGAKPAPSGSHLASSPGLLLPSRLSSYAQNEHRRLGAASAMAERPRTADTRAPRNEMVPAGTLTPWVEEDVAKDGASRVEPLSRPRSTGRGMSARPSSKQLPAVKPALRHGALEVLDVPTHREAAPSSHGAPRRS